MVTCCVVTVTVAVDAIVGTAVGDRVAVAVATAGTVRVGVAVAPAVGVTRGAAVGDRAAGVGVTCGVAVGVRAVGAGVTCGVAVGDGVSGVRATVPVGPAVTVVLEGMVDASVANGAGVGAAHAGRPISNPMTNTTTHTRRPHGIQLPAMSLGIDDIVMAMDYSQEYESCRFWRLGVGGLYDAAGHWLVGAAAVWYFGGHSVQ